ncbi:MAG TPA: GNAT family N-acetyltransferase [Candidatus Binataceae bacterium]|nr:GNAT family N-acetyltransferase [Candidatus Binataceae bacterium]
MAPEGTYVSTLFPEHFDSAAIALGRAFIKDPTFTTILPQPQEPIERARRLTDLFRAALAIQRKLGEPVFGVLDGKVMGAAVVAGTGRPSVAATIATGLAQLPRLLNAIGWGGFQRAISTMDELARNHPPEPHIYLNFLGVDPEFQRRHLGGALLEHLRLLALARRELIGVYLETATEENVAYYSARGYEVIGELRPLGCRMWRMLQRRR